MQEASTKEHPIMSNDYVAPGGHGYAKGGNYGKGYGGKYGGGGWYQPGHVWPAPPSMYGPYHQPATYGGKGASAYGKGKGGKGKAGHEGPIKPVKTGDADSSKEESDASMYRSSSSSARSGGSAWQKRLNRRKVARDKAALEEGAGVVPPITPAVEPADTADAQAKAIMERMDAVNALMTSLKGRTDVYSVSVRAQLIKDMAQLRLQKTQLKPLGDQTSILEALFEKKTSMLLQAEQEVQQAIATMEQAKASLVEVEQQLTNVKAAKAKEDQLIMSQQAEQQLPDNRMAVTKMKDLLCLLPAEKAGDFGEMLNLLDGMLKEASGPVIHAVDSDSEMAPSECPVPQTPSASSLMAEVPAFPSAVVAHTDPYSGGGAITPRRRTRSESPRRSPGSRSRSTDNRRQCPMTNAFSRRELGGPFMG